MQFGLTISARDQSQQGLRSAMSSIQGFARSAVRPIMIPVRIASGGLALLRDINLGLRPVLAGLDRMIERGAALETQQRAFGKFTQLGTRDSAGFARSLQQSALWTLRLGEALTVANRAMTTNIPREALDDLFKFAARRAAATGETTAGIIGGLVSGLGIGSARTLKQFGLDIEHVAENYDRIHGSGAFDGLDFAARQAMVLRAAMGEMRREVQLLKFTGRETIFSWQAIKTHVGDMTDKLFAAVARSDAMRVALGGIRDILGGISAHFEKGGSFKELLFGKGESGGVVGLLKAAMLDAGEALGRGMLGGALKVLGSFSWLFEKSASVGVSALDAAGLGGGNAVGQMLRGGRRFNNLTDRAEDVTQYRGTGAPDRLAEALAQGQQNLRELFLLTREMGIGALLGFGHPPPPGQEVASPDWREAYWRIARRAALATGLGVGSDNTRGSLPSGAGLGWGLGLSATKATKAARGGGNLLGTLSSLTGIRVDVPELMGTKSAGPTTADWLRNAGVIGQAILSGGGGWGRSGEALDQFLRELPGQQPGAAAYLRDAPGQYALTPVARRSLMRQAAVMRWRMRQVEQGNFGVRQRALRSAGEEIAGLRREGYAIGPRQEREIRERHLSGEREAAMGGLREKYDGLRGQISASDRRRREDARDSRARREGREDADADRREQRTADAAHLIAEKVDQLVAMGQALIGSLVGGQAQMAKAR